MSEWFSYNGCMEKSAENRFAGLDLIKVIAIAWICVYHLLDYYHHWQLGTLYGSGTYWDYFSGEGRWFSNLIKMGAGLGVMGVNLFMIASGLGLAMSASRLRGLFLGTSFRSRLVDYKTFIVKRLLRILPSYWITLVVLLLLAIYHGQAINHFDYAAHFLGISNFFPQYVMSISAPFWFIGTILQLYLLFPPLFILSKKYPALLMAGALLAHVFLGPQLTETFGGGRFFTEYIVDFVVGIIIGNVLIKNPHILFSRKLLILILPLAFLFLVILTNNVYSYGYFGGLIYQICAAILFVLLFSLGGTALSSGFGEKFSKTLSRLSSLSFIVFLTHYTLITELLPRVNWNIPFWAVAIIFLPLFFIFALGVNKGMGALKKRFFVV